MPTIVPPFSSGGSGAGGYVLINEVVLAAATKTITFASIPATYRHLRLEGIARSTFAAQTDTMQLFVNSDVGTDYGSHFWSENYASSSVEIVIDPLESDSGIALGEIAASSSEQHTATSFIVEIPYYTQTNFWTNIFTTIWYSQNDNAPQYGAMQMVGSTWENFGVAVSNLQFMADGGNFGPHTRISLYGIV